MNIKDAIYGRWYEFILTDGSVLTGWAGDSGVLYYDDKKIQKTMDYRHVVSIKKKFEQVRCSSFVKFRWRTDLKESKMLEGYRTIIASAIALLGAILQQSGVDIDEEGLTTAVMTIGGAASAIWFRYKATRNLHAGEKLK